MSVGKAPGIAPIIVDNEEMRFKGVYRKIYVISVESAKKAVSQLIVESIIAPIIEIMDPNTNASVGEIRSSGTGRFSVRFIKMSKSLSTY